MAKKKAVKKQTKKRPLKRGHYAVEDIDQIEETLCKILYKGAYIETACAIAGIHKDTFYRWMDEGAKDKAAGHQSRKAAFSDAIQRADAEGELYLVNHMHIAAEKNWNAAAHMLAVKKPKRWGKKQILRVEDEETKDSSFKDENLNDILAKKIAEHEDDNGRWD